MITNKTKNFTIIKNKRFAKGIFSQAIGLMFRLKKPDFGLIFPMKKEKVIPLTMWFVFFQIDVLFLDKNKRVVEMKKGFKPFTNYYPKNKAMYVVELPAGKIKKTSVGDKIGF